jgi:catechol 2,3-dioxygenase-like lactoylglutathione lyase family enzyme
MKIWPSIVTPKVQQSQDFYSRLFGCEVLHEGEVGWFVLLRLGSSELEFMQPNQASQASAFHSAFAGQGVWTAMDVEDAEAEFGRLRALGVAIEVDLRDELWGDRHVVVVDPKGIGVDVVQRVSG